MKSVRLKFSGRTVFQSNQEPNEQSYNFFTESFDFQTLIFAYIERERCISSISNLTNTCKEMEQAASKLIDASVWCDFVKHQMEEICVHSSDQLRRMTELFSFRMDSKPQMKRLALNMTNQNALPEIRILVAIFKEDKERLIFILKQYPRALMCANNGFRILYIRLGDDTSRDDAFDIAIKSTTLLAMYYSIIKEFNKHAAKSEPVFNIDRSYHTDKSFTARLCLPAKGKQKSKRLVLTFMIDDRVDTTEDVSSGVSFDLFQYLIKYGSPLPSAYTPTSTLMVKPMPTHTLMLKNTSFLSTRVTVKNLHRLRSHSFFSSTFLEILNFKLLQNQKVCSKLDSSKHKFYSHFSTGDFILDGNLNYQPTDNDKLMLYSGGWHRQELFRFDGKVRSMVINIACREQPMDEIHVSNSEGYTTTGIMAINRLELGCKMRYTPTGSVQILS